MTYLRVGMLVAFLLIQVASSLASWMLKSDLKSERQTSANLAQQLTSSKEDARRNLAAARQMASNLELERAAKATILTLHAQLRTDLNRREKLIEDLKRENKELQDWATRPLPDAARRLRDRPAITGADAYRKWLSGSGAVHPPGNSADQQRPVAN